MYECMPLYGVQDPTTMTLYDAQDQGYQGSGPWFRTLLQGLRLFQVGEDVADVGRVSTRADSSLAPADGF